MLGFGSISSRSISGSPFALVVIPVSLAATATISFALSGRIGVFTPIRAAVSFSFAGTPALYVNQALSAVATLAFDIDANLRVAGKPIVLSAVPVCYTLRAMPGSHTLKAASEPFTVRGVR